MPRCWWAISRPRKRKVTLTLSPSPKKRRIDRSSVDTALDETDKDIARTLLGKKKKKPKVVPVYRKGWFTLLAVSALLAGLGYLLLTGELISAEKAPGRLCRTTRAPTQACSMLGPPAVISTISRPENFRSV